MYFIPRKDGVDANDRLSRVNDAFTGTSRMTNVVVETYASIMLNRFKCLSSGFEIR